MEHAKLGGIRPLFKKAWARTRERYAALVLPWLVVFGVLFVVMALAGVSFGISALGFSNTETAQPSGLLGLTIGIFMVVATLVTVVFVMWETAAVAFAAAVVKKPSFKEVWHAGWKFFWPVVWLQFLVGLIAYASFFLLIIPAIYFSIAFAFVLFVCVHENKRGMAALLRSKELVQGNWWRVLWRFLLGGIAVSVPYMVLAFAAANRTDALAIILQLAAVVYEFLFMLPFMLGFTGELYHELFALKPAPGPIHLKKSRWKFAALTVGGYLVGIIFLALPLMAMLPVFLNNQSDQSDLQAINEWDEEEWNDRFGEPSGSIK